MMPTAERVKVVADRPETVTITPMSEFTPPIKRQSETAIIVHVFAKTEEGFDRKVLIPARDARFVNTKLKIEVASTTLPFVFTPPSLLSRSLEVFSYQIDEKTKELLVRVHCFNPSSMYLEHGSPLAILRFVSMITIEAKQ